MAYIKVVFSGIWHRSRTSTRVFWKLERPLLLRGQYYTFYTDITFQQQGPCCNTWETWPPRSGHTLPMAK